MYSNDHRSTIYNTQDMEATWVSTSDEWVKKMWYIHKKDYYSAIKESETNLLVGMWMNLEPVIQCKVSQKEKNKYHILMHIYAI